MNRVLVFVLGVVATIVGIPVLIIGIIFCMALYQVITDASARTVQAAPPKQVIRAAQPATPTSERTVETTAASASLEPQEVACRFFEAVSYGDYPSARTCLAWPADKALRDQLDVVLQYQVSLMLLGITAVERFGSEGEAVYGSMATREQKLATMQARWRQGIFTHDGDSGELRLPIAPDGEAAATGVMSSLKFRRVAGKWLIDSVGLVRVGWLIAGGDPDERAEKLASRLALIQEVRAGQYNSAQEVRDEDRRRAATATQASMTRFREAIKAGRIRRVDPEPLEVEYVDRPSDAEKKKD